MYAFAVGECGMPLDEVLPPEKRTGAVCAAALKRHGLDAWRSFPFGWRIDHRLVEYCEDALLEAVDAGKRLANFPPELRTWNVCVRAFDKLRGDPFKVFDEMQLVPAAIQEAMAEKFDDDLSRAMAGGRSLDALPFNARPAMLPMLCAALAKCRPTEFFDELRRQVSGPLQGAVLNRCRKQIEAAISAGKSLADIPEAARTVKACGWCLRRLDRTQMLDGLRAWVPAHLQMNVAEELVGFERREEFLGPELFLDALVAKNLALDAEMENLSFLHTGLD
jgi:hypothetical protein